MDEVAVIEKRLQMKSWGGEALKQLQEETAAVRKSAANLMHLWSDGKAKEHCTRSVDEILAISAKLVETKDALEAEHKTYKKEKLSEFAKLR